MRLRKTKPTSGEALVAIAETSPEALKVTADLMEKSKEEVIAQLEGQLATEKANHAETKRQLSRVARQLALMRGRIYWLLGDAFPDETIEEIETELEGRPQ